MRIVLKLVVYVVSVLICNQFADGYWVVGPVFGAAVLVYDTKALRMDMIRGAVYLAASTLIWALVYRLSGLDWGNSSDLFEYFIGPFPTAVLAGSILLPLAHARLLRKPLPLAARAAISLSVTFYLVTVLGYMNEEWGIGPNIPWLTVSIAVWQGTYLWVFFRKRA